jgi:hypothetical protein
MVDGADTERAGSGMFAAIPAPRGGVIASSANASAAPNPLSPGAFRPVAGAPRRDASGTDGGVMDGSSAASGDDRLGMNVLTGEAEPRVGKASRALNSRHEVEHAPISCNKVPWGGKYCR